jgi:DNA (cytosine-5)-methyltransferase 1
MMDDWFPHAVSMPIPAREAIAGIESKTFNRPLSNLASQIWDGIRPGQNGTSFRPGYYMSVAKLSPDKPCPTITKTVSGTGGLMHWQEKRTMSMEELRRLASYPDAFRQVGNFQTQHERIGNSVPPLFMRSIARNLRSMIETGTPIKQSKLLAKVKDYPALLEACWLEHLAPRDEDAPTVISTFAGCGGSSLGYSMAGFRELLAVEWDDNAVETFKLNFPDVPVYHGDIEKLSVEDVLQRTGLKVGELDVFDGSPPCQGFSTAGKREMTDPRNQLFREYVRLLRGLKPKVFVMENVSGMVKGRMKIIFADIMRELKASGYRVSARLLNAMYFNVPQSRQRMIFIGVREDLNFEPSHPEAITYPVTVAEALGINASQGYGFFTSGYNQKEIVDFNKASPVIMKEGIYGSAKNQFRITLPLQDGPLSYLPAPEVTGKTASLGFALKPGQNGSDLVGKGWQSLQRPALDKPSPTVIKEGALWKRYPSIIHPTENRGVAIGELRRLSSFPDHFQFVGKWVEAWARIGNSVPPLFMRSIAGHIRRNILGAL